MKQSRDPPRYKHLEVILYPDKWDVPSIVAEINKRTTVIEYVIVFHNQDVSKDGTPIEPHYHVYLRFSTAWDINQCRKVV